VCVCLCENGKRVIVVRGKSVCVCVRVCRRGGERDRGGRIRMRRLSVGMLNDKRERECQREGRERERERECQREGRERGVMSKMLV
jgi:hypothetical protein